MHKAIPDVAKSVSYLNNVVTGHEKRQQQHLAQDQNKDDRDESVDSEKSIEMGVPTQDMIDVTAKHLGDKVKSCRHSMTSTHKKEQTLPLELRKCMSSSVLTKREQSDNKNDDKKFFFDSKALD